MNKAEKDVMDKLIEAWNAFVNLPVEHPDDVVEFRHKFHDLQRIVMVRSVRRKSYD